MGFLRYKGQYDIEIFMAVIHIMDIKKGKNFVVHQLLRKKERKKGIKSELEVTLKKWRIWNRTITAYDKGTLTFECD